jgi:hypothetical protein
MANLVQKQRAIRTFAHVFKALVAPWSLVAAGIGAAMCLAKVYNQIEREIEENRQSKLKVIKSALRDEHEYNIHIKRPRTLLLKNHEAEQDRLNAIAVGLKKRAKGVLYLLEQQLSRTTRSATPTNSSAGIGYPGGA